MNVAKLNSTSSTHRWYRIPAALTALLAVNVCLVALTCAQESRSVTTKQRQQDGSAVTQIEGPNNVANDAVRFEAIDIFVDSGTTPLAAYQFELACETPGVEIVGIEGGEHAAFAEPPFYDPKAMNNNRVILAAFNTGKDLPYGRSRVARIHVQLEGPGLKEYRTKLAVSATADGEQVPATLTVAKAKG